MNSTISIVNHTNGGVLWSGPCRLNNFFAINQSPSITLKGVMLFDSETMPVAGDRPVRSWAIGADSYVEKEFEGGRQMIRGVTLVATDLSSPYAYRPADAGINEVIHFDASIAVAPPAPKPVDLLPILEKLTVRLESLPSVPPTAQATRPANTSKPAP